MTDSGHHIAPRKERVICFACGKRRVVKQWVEVDPWLAGAYCAECWKAREELTAE